MNAYEKYITIDDKEQKDNYYEACSKLMDYQLRIETKNFMKDTTDEDLLNAYCEFHMEQFKEEFEGANL